MGPARTINRQVVEKKRLSRPSFGTNAGALEAEVYAKLSKLPKVYMVTPPDRQDNDRREHRSGGEKSTRNTTDSVGEVRK